VVASGFAPGILPDLRATGDQCLGDATRICLLQKKPRDQSLVARGLDAFEVVKRLISRSISGPPN
jgi:hypothetical protein